MDWVLLQKKIPYENTSYGEDDYRLEQTIVIDGRIYAFTYREGEDPGPGRLQVLIFNADNDSWDIEHPGELITKCRDSICTPELFVVAYRHVAYVLRNDDGMNWSIIRCFDVETREWGRATTTGDAARCGCWAQMCVVNSKLLMWQTFPDSYEVFTFCLDLDTMVWRELPGGFRRLPECLVAVGDKVYACLDGQIGSLYFAYFDTTTETYEYLHSTHDIAVGRLYGAFLMGGSIYVMSATHFYMYVLRYCIESDVWEKFTLETPPYMDMACVSMVGERVYIFTFYDEAFGISQFSFLPSLRFLCLKVVRELKLDTRCLPATLRRELSLTS